MQEPADHWAHSRRDADGTLVTQALPDHLYGVADRARESAARLVPDWAWLAGLWHDLGKYRPGFQTYLRQTPDAHIEGRLTGPARRDKTHSAAGALHTMAVLGARDGPAGERAARLLAYVIAGHHAGLADWVAGLDNRLLGTRADDSRREYEQALAACTDATPQLLNLPAEFDLRRTLAAVPGAMAREPLAWSLWVRMLFSALVDADFLDTEAFMNAGRADARDAFAPLAQYRERLDKHLARMAQRVAADGREADPIMQQRAAVLRRCHDQAPRPAGVYSLEVPTGGGKTLSSLAFALAHAVHHAKRRVVYAIPYTSIIEQTADVFAAIFGRDAVVEHHSQADASIGSADDAHDTAASRLACENWDAPLVVTTNVQLFESLFAARTSRCRKLHNLADSVIVLDEAQLLPPEFLQPILDTLRLLVDHYGVTLLLCTATQPVLDRRTALRPAAQPARAGCASAPSSSSATRCSTRWSAWPSNGLPTCSSRSSCPMLAQRMAGDDCVLAIVNTRQRRGRAAVCARRRHRPAHAAPVGRHVRRSIAPTRSPRFGPAWPRAAPAPIRDRCAWSARNWSRPVSTSTFRWSIARWRAWTPSPRRQGAATARALLRRQRAGRGVRARPSPTPLAALRAGAQATRSTLRSGRPARAERRRTSRRYFRHYYDGFQSRDAHGIVDLLRCDSHLRDRASAPRPTSSA